MNIRYSRSLLARALAGAALAASIVGSVRPASAVTCTKGFPITNSICQQGTSKAVVSHVLQGNPARFQLSVDWQGGSMVAAAYGIDANGNHLNTCARTAADDLVFANATSPVSCSLLYGTAGTAFSALAYDHPFNMVSTFVLVI